MKTALTSPHPLHQDLGLLLLRAMLAVVFLWHGSQKLFGLFGGHGIDGTAGWLGSIGVPLPTLSAILAGASEFGGGLALATGFAFRLTLPPLVFAMLVAAILTGPGRLRLAPTQPLPATVPA